MEAIENIVSLGKYEIVMAISKSQKQNSLQEAKIIVLKKNCIKAKTEFFKGTQFLLFRNPKCHVK